MFIVYCTLHSMIKQCSAQECLSGGQHCSYRWHNIIAIYVMHMMLPHVSVYKKWRTESCIVVFSWLAMDSLLHLLEYHLLQPSKAIKDSGYDKSGSSESGIDCLCTQ